MEHKGMPKEIAEIYEALFSEVCEMRARWKLYCELFAQDKETVELLKWSANEFFGLLQWLLADDVLLSLSRITDPSKNRVQENLSLNTLVDRIDRSTYPSLTDELDKLLLEAKNACELARTHRHKTIAHNDLRVALKDPTAKLSKPLKKDIDLAIQAVQKVMDKVEEFFDKPDPDREIELEGYSGSQLLATLMKAKKYVESSPRN